MNISKEIQHGKRAIYCLVPTLVFVLSAPQVTAEVFKCTSKDGKTSYADAPCATAGATEVVVPIVPPSKDAVTAGKNWAAENAASNARFKASEAEAAASRAAAVQPSPAKTTQQIIAECEANRGVNCSSAKEIARRASDERTLTPEEVAAQQGAVAGRRVLEKAAAEAAAKAKEAAKTSGSATPVVPAPTAPPKTGK
jgi:hypothetical protein